MTGFRYALVECDSIPMEEQEKRYKELKLPIACLSKSGKRTSSEERKKIISTAFQLCCMEGAASVNDMAEYTGLSEKTIRRYLNEAGGYEIKKGLCYAEPDRDNGT